MIKKYSDMDSYKEKYAAYHEHKNQNRLFYVAIVDDMREIFEESIVGSLDMVRVNGYSIREFNEMLDYIKKNGKDGIQGDINYQIKYLLGEVIIFDGTYTNDGISTAGLYKKLMTLCPEYKEKTLFLIGKDMKEYMQKILLREKDSIKKFELQKQYNDLFDNTQHTLYMNKQETINEWLLLKGKELGVNIEKRINAEGFLRPEYLTGAKKLMLKYCEIIKLQKQITELCAEINNSTPQNESERLLQTATLYAEGNARLQNHTVRQIDDSIGRVIQLNPKGKVWAKENLKGLKMKEKDIGDA